MRTALIVCLMVFLAGGCNNGSTARNDAAPAETSVAKHNLSPEELGQIGAKIQKNPDNAEQLLAQHGLNQEAFQQAVRKVAENPEESKRYAEAYRKASNT